MAKVEIGRDAKHLPIIIDYNDEWSLRNFANQSNIFAGRGKELDGMTIYASCFYQESLDIDVFPSDVKNLTLVYCNLDNVNISAGVTVIANRPQRHIQVQNDCRDWELDANNQPIKLVNEKAELILGRSIDPVDIPQIKLESIDDLPSKFDYVKVAEKQAAVTVDEKALLASLMNQPDIAASSKDLTQAISDQIDQLIALQIKLGSGK